MWARELPQFLRDSVLRMVARLGYHLVRFHLPPPPGMARIPDPEC